MLALEIINGFKMIFVHLRSVSVGQYLNVVRVLPFQ